MGVYSDRFSVLFPQFSYILLVLCVVLLLFVLLYVLFVCECVLYYYHPLTTQLQLTNITHIISYRIISYHKPISVNAYVFKPFLFCNGKVSMCRSQWLRGLRRSSAAARLLKLWVRIPPGAWMFVCCECCVLSGRGLCDELITRPEEPYRL